MTLTAMTADTPVTRRQISTAPTKHRPHFSHAADRIWLDTTCHLDLWIDVPHCLGLDPVPVLACELIGDHDGMRWSFLKQQPEDLRCLYGVKVAEENIWLPVLETIESGPARGVSRSGYVGSADAPGRASLAVPA